MEKELTQDSIAEETTEAVLAPQAEEKDKKGKPVKKDKKLKIRKQRKWVKWVRILVILVVIVGLLGYYLNRAGQNINAQISSNYLVSRVVRQDLTVSVSGTASLLPADSYNVTTLTTGEIVSDSFEEDQLVEKGSLLYTLDSSDVSDSVSRANVSVGQAEVGCDQAELGREQAQLSREQAQLNREQAELNYQQLLDSQTTRVPLTGILNELYVHNGDTVTAGTALGKVVADTSLSIDFMFSYGNVNDFYVGQSATVFLDGYDGSVLGTVTYVSSGSAITSNGREVCSVRVQLNNPGVVSTSNTAVAVIGNYTSYGDAPIYMPASSTILASGSGTVQNMNAIIGATVTEGDVFCNIDSDAIRDQLDNAQIAIDNAKIAIDNAEVGIGNAAAAADNARLSLESAQINASSTAKNFDDYRITAPITGTVVQKNAKAGDKVTGLNSGNLAVIYDLSYLKMELAVDELDIGKVQVGQTVEITADALEGQQFTGVVDRISINGTTASGATSYPVTIIIRDYGDLKPGMNVSAKIIGEEIPDALCIPVNAVSRGNVVTVPGEGAMNEDQTGVMDITKLEEREVTLGRNDEDYIEITSGLEEGDIVLILNQASSFMQSMMGG